MFKHMPNGGMQALLLTADPLLVTTFTNVSRELGIEVQSSKDSQEVSDRFQRRKYEALILDLDTVPAALPVLDSVRKNRPNQHSVIFAVTNNSEHREKALQEDAHFLLTRPIQSAEIRATMDVAYDFMFGERRRYFRCATELPVRLTVGRLGSTMHGSTINVSSNGIAVKMPIPLALAETLNIEFFLPDGFLLRATGIVIWDDKHGKSGIKLRCNGPEMRQRLDSWLDSQFADGKKRSTH
jgi:DNA-binding response OmpR family regulator